MLLDGHEEAFDAIYNRYAIPLLNAAYRRLQSKEEAKEVVQEVFISLYLKRGSIKYAGNLQGYLFTALRNRILDIFRTDLIHTTHHQYLNRHQDKYTTIEPLLEQKELEARLQQLIAQLPDKCREAFLLSRYHGLSYREVAEKLQISVNTVEKHIGKALRMLRMQLGETKLLLLIVLIMI
jgi:RNA polymerase sigma-70 factor (family 1)